MLGVIECTGYFNPTVFEILRKIVTFFSVIIPVLLIISLIVKFSKHIINNDDDIKGLVKISLEKIFIAVFAMFICLYGIKLFFNDNMLNKLTEKRIFQTEYCALANTVYVRPNGVDNNKLNLKITHDFGYDTVVINGETFKEGSNINVTLNSGNKYTLIFYADNEEVTSISYDCTNKTLCNKKEEKVTKTGGGNNKAIIIDTGEIYEVPDAPSSVKTVSDVTPEMINEAVKNLAINVGQNNKLDFIYSGYYAGKNGEAVYASKNEQSYKGQRFSGITVYGTRGWQVYSKNGTAGSNEWTGYRFVVECVGYQNFIVRFATKMGNESYTRFYANSSWGYTYTSTSNLEGGELLCYDGHCMISVGKINGTEMVSEVWNSHFPDNWSVRLSKLDRSKGISATKVTKVPNGVNYNKVVSEPTLWAKADTVKPEISSLTYDSSTSSIKVVATDKTGDNFSDTNGNGINGYTITTSNIEPVNWENLEYDTSVKVVKTTEFTIDNVSSGTYYVWVRDRGGNVNYKTIIVK